MKQSKYIIVGILVVSIVFCQQNNQIKNIALKPDYNLIKIVSSGNDTMLIYQKGTKNIEADKATDYINQMLYPGYLFNNDPSYLKVDAKNTKGYFIPVDTTLYNIIDMKYEQINLLGVFNDTLYFTDDFSGSSKSLILYAIKSGKSKIISLPESGLMSIYPELNQIYLLQDEKICLYSLRSMKKINEWPEDSIKDLSLTIKGVIYITQYKESYDNPMTYSLSHPNVKIPGMLISRYVNPENCYLFDGKDTDDWSINLVNFTTMKSKKVICPVQYEFACVMDDSLFLVQNFTYNNFLNNRMIYPNVSNGIYAVYLIYKRSEFPEYPLQCNLSEVIPGMMDLGITTAVYDSINRNIYISDIGRIIVVNLDDFYPYHWKTDFNITF